MTTREVVASLRCVYCQQPAVCVGRYDLDEDAPPEPSCDEHCGHGNEDGRCYHLLDEDGELNSKALTWALEASRAA